MNELPRIIAEILKEKGITALRPPQELSIKAGVLEGKNIVVSSPTSSGKTLVAEMAAVKHFENKGKTLYIVPLKSLANEKYADLRKKYEPYGLRCALSIGDLDEKDPYLAQFDIVITTCEKADSLIRHEAPFIRGLTCVVIDEVHLIDDETRGPTLEILITRLKEMLPKAQFLALSATISNDKELSDWLSAVLVKSDYRPIKLYEGVFFNDTLYFEEKSYTIEKKVRDEVSITYDTLKRSKQVLFFLGSRRNTESLASNLAKYVAPFLNDNEREKLDVLADKVLYALEQPTEQCRKLAELVRLGVGFHHAGLVNSQREVIETGFRERLIKALCATPTLAAGINLPAFRVVIRDLTRFSQSQGNYYIPVLEVKQMSGRAGRPGLEDYGEAILIAKSECDKEALFKEYINGEVEKVYSKLGVEPVLRTHVLALIANRLTINHDSLKKFFSRTFYAKQFGNLSMINALLENVVTSLERWGFVEKEGNNFFATSLGTRVSELYLDPLTASKIIEGIKNTTRTKPSSFNVLQTLCFSGGVKLLGIGNKDFL
ncbi:ATP-dependent DNA helicase Hel308 [Candidatus Tiddalikarchaeum anstoanum]|nr:ATP-dependent DNA helicase Hel308 [Candidatus Tiddalikarchaeum anstoanum]